MAFKWRSYLSARYRAVEASGVVIPPLHQGFHLSGALQTVRDTSRAGLSLLTAMQEAYDLWCRYLQWAGRDAPSLETFACTFQKQGAAFVGKCPWNDSVTVEIRNTVFFKRPAPPWWWRDFYTFEWPR
jgi:hypothetical protein